MADPRHAFQALLRRPLLWVLVFGGLAAYGVYALIRIPVEVLPSFTFPQISVITHEPGATAGELESQITWPIEGEILALPNLVDLRSTMGAGTAETDARFTAGTDPQTDLQAVNGALDRARAAMPAGAQPYAQIMGNAINEVADYALRIPAGVDPAQAQRAVEGSVAPALRALAGVQRVIVYGGGRAALWVQPSLTALRRYRVPAPALAAALRQAILLGPAGYLRAGHQDVFVEARNLPTHIAQLAQVPVAGAQGEIPLRDLARVRRAAIPALHAVALDGEPAVALTVFKQPNASTTPVTHSVRGALAATLPLLPRGVAWVPIYDQGRVVGMVGRDLSRNLALGGVLAIVAMLWVLGAGRGIGVLALSIPLSLLLAIAGLYALGQSLNLITLGALTVAVGLLADDGILVMESIYHRWEAGEERWAGIAHGLRDIAAPDISGTLTTVAVFVPLLCVGGLAGLFLIPFALAMALALLASLAISLTLVPLTLGFTGAHAPPRATLAGRALAALRRTNLRLFHAAGRAPWLSLALCVALLGASLAGLLLVPVNVLPLPNEGVLLESFSLPPGTSMHDTLAAVDSISRRLLRDPATAHVFARIGSPSDSAYTEPGYAGEIQIALQPNVDVNSLNAIAARMKRLSRTPAVQLSIDTPTIERVGESLSGLPQPFVLDVYGRRISELRRISDRITARLRAVPGLSDVFNNGGYPVAELRLEPRPDALAAYRLTAAGLDRQLEPLLNGSVVAEVPDGNVPLPIYLRLAQAPGLTMRGLRRLPIATAGWTPLGQLAALRLVRTPNQVEHIAGARALEILATPNAALGGVIAAARRALASLRLPPGYRYAFGGLYPQLEHAAIGLAAAGLAALALMLGILTLQFDGALAPLLLLLVIPLAFTGGAALLAISGVGLNAMGLVAFLTLIGIGLNHGIVLLYRARRNEAAGMEVGEAVEEAVQVRFRPIVLTTLTAILGMLPTAFGWGTGAAPEQGLAVVTLGGVLWSALLSTNLIPALYLNRRRGRIARRGPA
jgi:cobalt-zinc-cadmium resistance protein CzcA